MVKHSTTKAIGEKILAADWNAEHKITSGLDAAKPISGLIIGQLYWATDTKILYRATSATTWEEILRGETVIRLAQLSEKLHDSLASVTADQHHNRSHDHSLAADGSPIAVAGVPNLDASKITTGQFPQPRIKTSTGTVSGTLAADDKIAIAMQDYCFFPNIYSAGGWYLKAGAQATASTGTEGRFSLHNTSTGSLGYTVNWRYISASGEVHQIWVIYDYEGKVLAVWEAPDPVKEGICPLSLIDREDVQYLKVNPEDINLKQIKKRAETENKEISAIIFEEFKVDLETKMLVKKKGRKVVGTLRHE